MADERALFSKLTSTVKTLSQSKATGADKAKLQDIQKKVAVFLADLKAKIDGMDKNQKEINDFKAKKTALIGKLDAYNKQLPKFHDDAIVALKAVNEARGKVAKEDQKAISEMFVVLSNFTGIPPSLKLEEE